jgi:hypothetical protein
MKHKINLALPVYGSSYRSEFVRSLFGSLTSAGLANYSFVLSEIDCNDIVYARNYLLSNFFYRQQDCSHVLMVDNDMGFAPDVIPAMLTLNKPVVGAIYPKRSINLRKLHSLSALPFEKAVARSLDFVGTIKQPSQTRDGFVRMTDCGTGVLLISRDCVAEMIERLPEIVGTSRIRATSNAASLDPFLRPFDRIKVEHRELSEDFSFCHRWAEQCGGEIWACYDRRFSHVGSLTVVSAYSDLA